MSEEVTGIAATADVDRFTYAFIPADTRRPVESKVGSKSGGLQDDELIKEAKRYFFELSGGPKRVGESTKVSRAICPGRKGGAHHVRFGDLLFPARIIRMESEVPRLDAKQ